MIWMVEIVAGTPAWGRSLVLQKNKEVWQNAYVGLVNKVEYIFEGMKFNGWPKWNTGKFSREKATSPFSGGLGDTTAVRGNIRIEVWGAKSHGKTQGRKIIIMC